MKKSILITGIALLLLASIIVVLTPFGRQKLTSLNRRVTSFINHYKPKEAIPATEVNQQEAKAVLETANEGTEEGFLNKITKRAVPTLPPPPSSFRVSSPIQQEYQTWNNCGPATTTMLLRQMGVSAVQAEAASYMKPNPDDKNVSPDDIIRYLTQERGLNAIFKLNGDDDTLKQLVSKGYPVIVEQWFEPDPGDEMGHYRLVTGYDDAKQQYITMDSYLGPNRVFSYKDFNKNWKVFNYAYITVYKPEQEEEIKQILGENWNEPQMNVLLQDRAVKEIEADNDDEFAWFNLGVAYSRQGKHKEAAVAFDRARQIGLPLRMLWYQFEIFESYLDQGRYDDVIELTNINLKNTNTLEESYYYRGRAYEAQGKTEEAKRDYQRAIELNKNYQRAGERL